MIREAWPRARAVNRRTAEGRSRSSDLQGRWAGGIAPPVRPQQPVPLASGPARTSGQPLDSPDPLLAIQPEVAVEVWSSVRTYAFR